MPSKKKNPSKQPSAAPKTEGENNISWSEVTSVQSWIEKYLQQYMSQAEIIAALKAQANVDPALTCLVWQKLEEQNPSFFKAYNYRLRLKDQIVAFNYLVEQQKKMQAKVDHPESTRPESLVNVPPLVFPFTPRAAATDPLGHDSLLLLPLPSPISTDFATGFL